MKESVLHFPDDSLNPSILDVGEKGQSLFHLAKSGLCVPEGYILTVEFFKPWIKQVEDSSEWQKFISLSPDKMWGSESMFEKLPEFVLTEEQQKSLDEALSSLKGYPLLALRSVLADPILSGTSFADRYETHLAIKPEEVRGLLGRIFASCIDPRIYMIQKKRGLEVPRILVAVIVQAQISGEASGNIYSVDPDTNDHDFALIESVWGLGDHLADHAVEPDRIVFDKLAQKVVRAKLGSKKITRWINFQNEVERRPEWKSAQSSLTREQVQSVASMLRQAEAAYASPIRLEWTISQGKVYILQATPLSPIVQLSPKLMTRPGEKRRLYLNITASILGVRRPLSVSATDLYNSFISELANTVFGRDAMGEYWRRLITCWHGSIYLDVSQLLFHFRKETVIALVARIDAPSARILEGMDVSKLSKPDGVYGMPSTIIRMMIRSPLMAVKIIGSFLFPKVACKGFEREATKAHKRQFDRSIEKLPLQDALKKSARIFARTFMYVYLPALASSWLAKRYLRRTFAETASEHWSMSEHLRSVGHYHPDLYERVLPLELHYLSRLVKVENIETEADLIRLLHQDDVPPSFRQAWLHLLERFGKKGPGMADLNVPRFAEEYLQLLPSMFHFLRLNPATKEESPQTLFEKNISKRASTTRSLVERAAVQFWPEILPVRKATQVVNGLSSAKERIEEEFFDVLYSFRMRLLESGINFSTHNRIEYRDQIFHLSFSQIAHAVLHPDADLRSILNEAEILPSRMARLIDSRGRIYESSSPDSTVTSMGVVPGKARAKARYLDSYRPQDFKPGEILVVSTLDSSWSPILVLASGVITEVGGSWSPGLRAIVEHNIPCVSGVFKATERIRTGDLVEIDGEKGSFRILNT